MSSETCTFGLSAFKYVSVDNFQRNACRFLFVEVQDKSVIVDLTLVISISEETYVLRVNSEQYGCRK